MYAKFAWVVARNSLTAHGKQVVADGGLARPIVHDGEKPEMQSDMVNEFSVNLFDDDGTFIRNEVRPIPPEMLAMFKVE